MDYAAQSNLSREFGELQSAAFVLFYNASDRSFAVKPGRQIGAYTDMQRVDAGASTISDNVERLTRAVVANYMSLNGTLSEFYNVVGDEGELDPETVLFK